MSDEPKYYKYSIIQYEDGYHVLGHYTKEHERSWYNIGIYYPDYRVRHLGVYKTLKQARKEKLKLELKDGKFIE